MQTKDLILLAGAGVALAYVLSQRKDTPASPVANTNTGRTPLSNLSFSLKTAQTPADYSKLVTAGSAAVKGIFDSISPWFKKSNNSLSSPATANAVSQAQSNPSTWVDTPASSGTWDSYWQDTAQV